MSRGHLALAGIACATAAFAVAFTWQHGIASLYDDSVSYLTMAQAMSPWEPTPEAIAAAFPDQRYPPLFPLWLGVAGGAYDWRLAHAWVALSFGAGVMLLGLPSPATACCGRCWRLPSPRRSCSRACRGRVTLNVKKACLDEVSLHRPLTLARRSSSIAAVASQASRPPRRRDSRSSPLLLAAAALTRTIGVALIAAVAIAEGWCWLRLRDRVRARELAMACAAAVLALGAWYALRPAGGEDAYASFSTAVARNAADRGAGWLAGLVGANLSAMADAWLTATLIFWGEPWKPGFVIACLFGASGLAGAFWRAARGEADAIYVIVFGAILAAWPFPGQMYRLALPAFPLVAMNALWFWQELLARMDPAKAVRWTVVAACAPLMMALLALGYIAMRAGMSDDLLAAARIPTGRHRRVFSRSRTCPRPTRPRSPRSTSSPTCSASASPRPSAPP